MGQIIRFPILVIDDKVSEEQYGITPQLRSEIRSLSSATTKDVASEAAIRKGIDSVTIEVSGENFSDGLPVYNSITGDNNITYHTISGIGNLNFSSDGEYIYLDTTQEGNPNEAVTGSIVLKRTLNGGIEQEASKINYSDFDSTTGVGLSGFPAFHNVNAGDVIGKILIKCTEAFNDPTTQFSIGTVTNPTYYTQKFSVSGGVTQDKLVEFIYGRGMNDKVEYIEEILIDKIGKDLYHIYNFAEAGQSITVIYTAYNNTWTQMANTPTYFIHHMGFSDAFKSILYITLGYYIGNTTYTFNVISNSWGTTTSCTKSGFYGGHKISSSKDVALVDATYSNNLSRREFNFINQTYATAPNFLYWTSTYHYYNADYGIEGNNEYHFHYCGAGNYNPIGANGNANVITDFLNGYTETQKQTAQTALQYVSMYGAGCELNETHHMYMNGRYIYKDSSYPTQSNPFIYDVVSDTWEIKTSNTGVGTWGTMMRIAMHKTQARFGNTLKIYEYLTDTLTIDSLPITNPGTTGAGYIK